MERNSTEPLLATVPLAHVFFKNVKYMRDGTFCAPGTCPPGWFEFSNSIQMLVFFIFISEFNRFYSFVIGNGPFDSRTHVVMTDEYVCVFANFYVCTIFQII